MTADLQKPGRRSGVANQRRLSLKNKRGGIFMKKQAIFMAVILFLL